MPDPKEDSPPEEKNQSIIDALRTQFGALTKRLTPELEPATVYIPQIPASKNPE